MIKRGNKNIFFLSLLSLVFFFLLVSLVSASPFGYDSDTGVTISNVNSSAFNNTYYINGSNINATSFSTACSGTDKVSNVTYSNFSGLFTIVCTTDSTGAGGLTWADIINGTLYASNNTYRFFNATSFPNYANIYLNTTNQYGYYNVTSLPASNEVFWNANLTAHNSTWNSINNATYNEAWLLATNGTFYKRITNEFNFTNKTLLSQFTNDLTFYVDNIHSYFNLTNFPNYANVYLNTSNQYNYTNKTLLSQFQNDGVFITWANAINGTLALNSSLSLNYFNYTNKTLLSQFTNDLTFYVDNTHSYWNDTYATFNKTYADTLYRAFTNHTINGNLIVTNNLTIDINLILANSNTNFVGINLSDPQNTLNVFGDFNVTGIAYRNNKAVIDWSEAFNGTLFKRADWDSNYSTNDPIWRSFSGTNYTTFLSHITWDKVINGTIWGQVLNGTVMKQTTYDTNYSTLYLLSNPLSFINWTHITNGTIAMNTTFNQFRSLTNNTFNGVTTFTNNISVGNITLGNNCIINQTASGGGSICHNGTGFVIVG